MLDMEVWESCSEEETSEKLPDWVENSTRGRRKNLRRMFSRCRNSKKDRIPRAGWVRIWGRAKNGFREVGKNITGHGKTFRFIISIVGNSGGFKQGKFMCESNFLDSSIFQLEYTFLSGGRNLISGNSKRSPLALGPYFNWREGS